MEKSGFDDITKAIWQLRAAFLKNGLQPPVSLELGTPEDGYKFMHLMPRDLVMSQPRMGLDEDRPQWVCNLMGVEVLRPAEWRSERGGKRLLADVRYVDMPPIRPKHD
jgi:hypothetical protein